MPKPLLLAAAFLSLCVSCGADQTSYTRLKNENTALKKRLAGLGVDTTQATASAALRDSVDAVLARAKGADSAATHPGSMWEVRHYVDDFGVATKNGYVCTAVPIVGKFSNSATQDSPLLATFLIDKDLSISIKLYEYAGNNSVKAVGLDSYDVNVRDKDGKAYRLRATNYESDRLTLDKVNSKSLHTALLKGGKLLFVVRDSDTPTTVYEFTLDNTDGYADARKKLRG